MDRNKLLRHLAFLMLFIFVANNLALKYHLYFSIWYLDMIMHYLGGLWTGLFFVYSFHYVLGTKVMQAPIVKLVLRVSMWVLLVGLAWEVFEYAVFNVIGGVQWDLTDTLSDLFFDLFGGLSIFIYLGNRIRLIRKSK